MSFRNNLQHLRATRNMTQEQLAMLLGVSRQSVTKWEAEKSYPEMDKLLKICQIFECSLDDLVTGDLTQRAADAADAVPQGLPVDVCGFDEHQRMLAKKVPTGIAVILVAIGLSFLAQGSSLPMRDPLSIVIILIGALAGLAFFIPAGMAHSQFTKAHPYIEDFYTEDDKNQARQQFVRGFLAACACVIAGIACLLFLGEAPETECLALCLLLLFIAAGAWLIVHFGMMLGRVNVREYNKTVADELEIEDIVEAQVADEIKDSLVSKMKHKSKVGAVCGTIMILATIVALCMLFIPVLSAPDPDAFEPEGTPTMFFWLPWVIGGLLCGIASVLIKAFAKDE